MQVTTVTYKAVMDGRQLEMTLDNGTVITAEACHESWEQWGGTVEELYVTQPIVEYHNDWLHGGELPFMGGE